MAPGLRLMVGAAREGLTVTVTAPEATDSDELSLTWSSKLQTPRVDKAPVETEGIEEVSQLKEPPANGL
jgi:hypothetical protein